MSVLDLQNAAVAASAAAQAATAAAGPSQSSAMHYQAAMLHQQAANAWAPVGNTAMVAQSQTAATTHLASAATLKAAGK